MAVTTAEAIPATPAQDIKLTSNGEKVNEFGDANESKSETDSDAHMQDGVKRVEAITTVWSKELLIVMFIL